MKKILAALIGAKLPDAKKLDLLSHERWSSSRLWIVLGFGLLMWWVTKGILTDANFQRLFWLVVVFLVTNTVSKMTYAICNTFLKIKGAAGDVGDDEDEGEVAAGGKETSP